MERIPQVLKINITFNKVEKLLLELLILGSNLCQSTLWYQISTPNVFELYNVIFHKMSLNEMFESYYLRQGFVQV